MIESTTVTAGLDVHARSLRPAAVRADELLEERTLAYDEEAVERVLRRWPGARCCYKAGPTGFGLYRYLLDRGIDCEVVAPGLVPQRPGDRVKTDPRDARKPARLLAGALLEPIHVPSPQVEAACDLVRAREGRASGSDVRPAAPLEVLSPSRTPVADQRLGQSSVVSGSASSASSTPPSRSPLTATCTPSISSTLASGGWSRRSGRRPSRDRGVSWSPDCAACAALTP
jgi:hypothetical protein